jgi:hypothetical protein
LIANTITHGIASLEEWIDAIRKDIGALTCGGY